MYIFTPRSAHRTSLATEVVIILIIILPVASHTRDNQRDHAYNGELLLLWASAINARDFCDYKIPDALYEPHIVDYSMWGYVMSIRRFNAKRLCDVARFVFG